MTLESEIVELVIKYRKDPKKWENWEQLRDKIDELLKQRGKDEAKQK